jgi:hypothetical protein
MSVAPGLQAACRIPPRWSLEALVRKVIEAGASLAVERIRWVGPTAHFPRSMGAVVFLMACTSTAEACGRRQQQPAGGGDPRLHLCTGKDRSQVEHEPGRSRS